VIDGALYVLGGFSYTAPYAYRDVLRLAYSAGEWSWTHLPDFPWPISSAGVASIGKKIYVLGGADYDSKAFYTFHDRHGDNPGLGRHLLMLDTANSSALRWVQLGDIPGGGRWVHAFSPAGGKLYAIGGATSNGSTTVDNWVYDPATAEWSRRENKHKKSVARVCLCINGHGTTDANATSLPPAGFRIFRSPLGTSRPTGRVLTRIAISSL